MEVFSFPKFSVCQDSFVIFFMFLQLILSDDSLLNRSSQILEEFSLLKKVRACSSFQYSSLHIIRHQTCTVSLFLEKLILSISLSHLSYFLEYQWKGNTRNLRFFIKSSVLSKENQRIFNDDHFQ